MEDRGHILIVDKDDMYLSTTAEMLHAEGYTCDIAADTETAEARMMGNTYDLLIADITMPGNTELEFVFETRKQHPHIPVLLVTDRPTVQTTMMAMRLTAVGYITKPVERQTFCDQVQNWVEHNRIAGSVRETQTRLEEWSRDLHLVEQVLDHSAGAAKMDTAKSVILLTMRNIVSNLIDIERLVDLCSAHANEKLDMEQLFVASKLDAFRAGLTFKSGSVGEG